MVLVFGFTTGGVIEGGLLGSLGSGSVDVDDPPPQATSSSDEIRHKKAGAKPQAKQISLVGE